MSREGILRSGPGQPRIATHPAPVDRPELNSRFDELRSLKDGWYDGKGLAPSIEGLNWLSENLRNRLFVGVESPCVYPVAEGGVRLEWLIDRQDISIEVDLGHRMGDWHELNLDDDSEEVRVLDLDNEKAWTWAMERLRSLPRNRS